MKLRLPQDARAPLLARAFARRAMCEKHSREARDEVELLVSELVTNAVVHGGSLVTMDIDCETLDGISVAVSDGSSTRPVLRHPGPMEEGGRGMELVELVSDAWGVREPGIPQVAASNGDTPPAPAPLSSLLPRQAQGKVVWFRLKG